jgi:hypothetical protein
MFVIPAVVVLLVSIAVISGQVVKTAISNPVKSLRMD